MVFVVSNGDSLDLLPDRRAANWTQAEFRGTGDTAAVVPTRHERAVHVAVETHLEHRSSGNEQTQRTERGGNRTARVSDRGTGGNTNLIGAGER